MQVGLAGSVLLSILVIGSYGFSEDAFASHNPNHNPVDGWQAAIAFLQSQIDSFFDIFVELSDVADQHCPPGQVVVGTDSIGKIICENIQDVVPEPMCPNDCSGNGICQIDNMCQCNAGFGGDDCSIPDEPMCSPGESMCGEICTDLQSDSNNCGQCGFVCDVGDTCTSGSCQAPAIESCNGIDDDNDGQIDEGNPGGGVSCDTGDLGICSEGITQCTLGSLQCTPLNLPSVEIEDGLDNDCNGIVDDVDADEDGFSVNQGDCDDEDSNTYPGAPELLDGKDNDCDGMVDEDLG